MSSKVLYPGDKMEYGFYVDGEDNLTHDDIIQRWNEALRNNALIPLTDDPEVTRTISTTVVECSKSRTQPYKLKSSLRETHYLVTGEARNAGEVIRP